MKVFKYIAASALVFSLGTCGTAYGLEDMKCEDPDFSAYSVEDFDNMHFENSAAGSVPVWVLSQEQLQYLEDNYDNCLYYGEVNVENEVQETEIAENDSNIVNCKNNFIDLTVKTLKKNGIEFRLDNLRKFLLPDVK